MRKKILSLLLVLLALSTLALYTWPPSEAENSEYPQLVCRKVEFIEATFSPDGKLLSKRVSVRFEIYNNGSSPLLIDLIDRTRCINASTLITLYGTPKYSEIDSFGNLTRIIWRNIEINSSESLRFYYSAETFRDLPIGVNSTLYVDGAKMDVKEIGGFYTISANLSSTLTIKVTLRNRQVPLYISGNKTLMQPIMCTVMVAFKNDYFSGVKTSPKANSTSFMGDKIMPTWMLFLGDEPAVVEASAIIIGMSEWGEIPLEPISVQVASTPEMLETYVRSMSRNMDVQIELMQNFTQVFDEMGQSTEQMSLALQEIANGLQQNSTILMETLVDTLNGTKALIQLADSTLEFSQLAILNANSSLSTFMNDTRVQQFLGTNSDLAVLLVNAISNMTLAYNLIDQARYGNGTVPGLSQICEQIDLLISQLTETNATTEQIVEGLYSLADGIDSLSSMASQMKNGLNESLTKLLEEKSKLEDILLTFNSRSLVPFNIEVRLSSTETKWNIDYVLEPIEDDVLRLSSLNFSNREEYNLTVVGVKIEFESLGDFQLRFEVKIGDRWELVNDSAYLGLEYDSEAYTLYSWPNIAVEPNSTGNVLVDWAGRPLRISIKNGNITQVDVDFIVSYVSLVMETPESQFLCAYNQPHVIVQNVTWEILQPPPAPPPEKSLTDIIMEHLQRPEVMATILIAIAAIIAITYIKKRARKQPSKELDEASRLMEEIDKLEKELSESK